MSKKGLRKVVIGAGIGATLGVLFAPKKGEETRKDLKNSLDSLMAKVKNTDAEEVRVTVEEKINEIKEGIKNLDKETVLEEAKKQAKKLQDASSELVEYVIEKGTPVLEKSATTIKEKVIEVSKEVTKKLEKQESTPKKVEKQEEKTEK